MHIVNIITGDTDLTHGGLILRVTSDCGRIVYQTNSSGPIIDGRKAWRGAFCDPETGRATQQQVSEDLWQLACEVISVAMKTEEAESERRRDHAHAAQDSRIDALAGIENVRGGAYDPGAY